MELSRIIQDTAEQRFHIRPRPWQTLVVQDILERVRCPKHHDLLVVLPTGYGKSLCFMLPSLLVEGYVLLVYPLRGLMNDQQRRFREAGIPVAVLQGGQSPEEREAVFRLLDAGTTRTIITNAETLEQPQIWIRLKAYPYSLVVVDEAHTVVQWGLSFRPSYGTLGFWLEALEAQVLAAFTATSSPQIARGLATHLFRGRPFKTIQASGDRPNITYRYAAVLSRMRALRDILSPPSRRPAIVFCPTRAVTRTMALRFLAMEPGIPVRYYHAGLSGAARKRIEAWFLPCPDAVLFATSAFGLGMDKPDIRTAVHLQAPDDVAAYLQESGRAGRDGERSEAWVLDRRSDRSNPVLDTFRDHTHCIRRSLLGMMGETQDTCTGCDVCDGKVHPVPDGQREILRALCFRPLLETPGSLADLLHHTILTRWDEREIEEAIHQLIASGTIRAVGNRLLWVPGKSRKSDDGTSP